jgi:Methyltransferase domain
VSRLPDKVPIGSVVTAAYLLDFLILYESLVESWAYYPFEMHAFVTEDEVERRLVDARIEDLEIHRLPGEPGDREQNAARRIDLVEHSGLERCIVSDADNLFLAETPELYLFLANHDLVFAGGPSLWSFRRTDRSVEFADRWRDGSTALTGLLKSEEPGDTVKALPGRPSPYAVDAGLPELSLEQDQLGFREEHAGRVKVLHFGGLGGRGNRSMADRIQLLVDSFPRAAPVLRLYAKVARRASARLGIEPVRQPNPYVRERLLEAGILPTRKQFPAFLNRRGLAGTGVEVGVKKGIFSETILEGWHGRKLISVDPWREGPAGEADPSTQAEHDSFYEETAERLTRFGERSEIWRMTSVEAAARVEPSSLDFVYVDALHDYVSVKADLEQWFAKIRPGGVFAGHDYYNTPHVSFRVKQAVDEFFAARGLPVKPTYSEGRWATWLVEIPAEPR